MVAPPMLVAAALAVVYMVWAPPSADLAAQQFRADVFAEHGFQVWSNAWYAGFHLPGYSLLFPPLAAVLGARLVGALSAVAAAGLFGALAGDRYGSRARLAALWFGAATATNLFTGRLTFALGVAIGLAAMLALQRSRPVLATGLAVLTALASPVAGLLAAIAGVAVAVARRPAIAGPGTTTWLGGLAVAFWSGAAIVAMAVAFPTGGVEPFVTTAFQNVPLFALVALLLIPAGERTLRWGVALYALAAVAVFVVDNPVGGNITRLGALFAGPLLALVLAGRRPLVLAVLALPLLWWQWAAPVRDVADAAGDPSTERSYHAPLIAKLDSLTGGGPTRIHVPPTRNRWEAAYVAPSHPLARGWMRQLESDDFDLFDDGNLTAEGYLAWLAEHGVSYVALSDAELDYLATDEARLIRAGLPYLGEVWSDEHWTLYEVAGDQSLVSGEAGLDAGARVAALEPDAFELTTSEPGPHVVLVRYSPYWRVTRGDACVERAGKWTRVRAREPAVVRVEAQLSLDAMLGKESDC